MSTSDASELLWRRMMYELQTGGGLAVPEHTGHPSARIRKRVGDIHRLANLVKQDSRAAPARAAAHLSRRGVPRSVLDIGAGRAHWSTALAAISQVIGVVAVDLPGQCDALATAVATSGCSGQFEVRTADALHDDLGDGYDVVIIANVCHLFPPHRNSLLIARGAAVLAPGGTLAVVDQVLDLAPDLLVWSALYAVGLPHAMPGGYLYTYDEYAKWFTDAGLVPRPAFELSMRPCHTLLEARR